jgi:hypothetical protein
MNAFRARSAVAHGFKPDGDIDSIVRALFELSVNLRAELRETEQP